METTPELEACIDLLEKNGFKEIIGRDGFMHFMKYNSIGIDINTNRMVFIGDGGDFLDLPTNKYTLIGVLIEYRQLPINYKS